MRKYAYRRPTVSLPLHLSRHLPRHLPRLSSFRNGRLQHQHTTNTKLQDRIIELDTIVQSLTASVADNGIYDRVIHAPDADEPPARSTEHASDGADYEVNVAPFSPRFRQDKVVHANEGLSTPDENDDTDLDTIVILSEKDVPDISECVIHRTEQTDGTTHQVISL